MHRFKRIFQTEVILVSLLWIILYTAAADAANGKILFPGHNATGVNPDTHLKLTFEDTPILGNSGCIRIYDAADNRLVDVLDLSIPSGKALPTTNDYQLTIISGFTDGFRFHLVIIRGNTAEIYPHHNLLEYDRTYRDCC